jgi:hypothetical protein
MQSKKQPKFFWVSAMTPLASVILGSVLVYFTHAENHGVQVVSQHFFDYYLVSRFCAKITSFLIIILYFAYYKIWFNITNKLFFIFFVRKRGLTPIYKQAFRQSKCDSIKKIKWFYQIIMYINNI